MYYYVCEKGFLALTNPNDNSEYTPVNQKEFEELLREAQEKETNTTLV